MENKRDWDGERQHLLLRANFKTIRIRSFGSNLGIHYNYNAQSSLLRVSGFEIRVSGFEIRDRCFGYG